MNIYPQLVTGTMSQFPIVKQRRWRTVVNAAADGSSIKLADPTGAIIGWRLQYTNLSDTEMAALQQFFTAMEGSLNSFTFMDPAANLLAWSEDLTNAAWQAAPFLTPSGGGADPLGGSNAWQLANSGEGAQTLTQTLNAPTSYTYCFSVYAFSSQPSTIHLRARKQLGTVRAELALESPLRRRHGRRYGYLGRVWHRVAGGRLNECLRTSSGSSAGAVAVQNRDDGQRL